MVSVIVPVYNTDSEYLRQCVKSVLAQTFSDWELILVDDGSQPNTAKLCDRLAALDPRICTVHTPNQGLSQARNTGIDLAQGDYITFLDSDDLLHKGFIATLLHPMLENQEVKLSCCANIRFDNMELSTRFLEFITEPALARFKPRTHLAIDSLEKMLYQTGVDNSACGKLFRRDIFTELRFTPGIHYEDLDFMYRCLDSDFMVAETKLPLYLYRQHPDSFMNRFSPKHIDNMDVTDRIEVHFEQREPRLQRAARDRRFAAYFNILTLLYANGVDDPHTQNRALSLLRERSGETMRNNNVRLKNRIGALLTLLRLEKLLPLLSQLKWRR